MLVRCLFALTMLVLVAFSLEAESDTGSTAQASLISELSSAGYDELVTRARELGLAPTGTVSELRSRVATALGITLPPEPAAASRLLTIDSANQAGLLSVEAPGDGKLLRLSGGLQVTLVDNEKKVTHSIRAEELWYDQANEEMTARGNVVYTMNRETSKEVFRGESLTFRLSDSQGVFYEGASDRLRTVGTQTMTFRYGGESIRRSSEDLVVMETGTITSSLGAEPYYRIQASRIWVLAPGEWGLQDAVLYLGRIPVMYFPFFFQPGDEFFFNPVLTFPDTADRRGTSLQTTTYFWGKKTKDASPFSFLQLEDAKTKEEDRVLKGLFLVRGKSSEPAVPSTWLLKATADFYSNLGFLSGVEISAPGVWGLKTATGSAGFGLTRTVGPNGLPFAASALQPSSDPWAQSDWNGSWLGPLRLPFRWGGRFEVDAGWGSLGMEYYTDPLLYGDLTSGRSENFSIFSLAGLGPAKKSVAATTKNSLQWTSSVNVAPATLGASLLWESKTVASGDSGPSGDPENTFYLPSQLTLPQLSLAWGGTLWPINSSSSSSAATKAATVDLIPPSSAQEAAPSNSAVTSSETTATILPPDRFDSLALPEKEKGWSVGANWSLKPTAKTDSRFDNATVLRPSDPAWSLLTSRWAASYAATLGMSAGWGGDFWVANQTFSLRQQAQETWYQGASVTPSQSATYDLQDRQQGTGQLSQSLTSALKPFPAKGSLRDSNLQYTLNSKLWDYDYQQTRTFDASKETITAHQVAAQGVWYLFEGWANLKGVGGWQSTLAPLDPVTTWSSGFDYWFPTFRTSTRLSARQTTSTLTYDPWESTAEWTPLSNFSLKEVFQYDLQASRSSVSTTSASAWGLTAQYRQQRTTPFRFNTSTKKWDVAGPPDFLPQELRIAYAFDLPAFQWWYDRNSLTARVSASWPINLQQYSQMPLSLNYTLGYRLFRFLDLQVSQGVINRTAYRYFPFLADSFGAGAVRAVNPLADLWDAVSIWDQAALQRTSFKMTNLSIALVHYLDDWQVKLDYSGAPALNAAATQFSWNGTFSLMVSWYPIPELKTQMQWDKDGNLSIAKNSSQ